MSTQHHWGSLNSYAEIKKTFFHFRIGPSGADLRLFINRQFKKSYRRWSCHWNSTGCARSSKSQRTTKSRRFRRSSRGLWLLLRSGGSSWSGRTGWGRAAAIWAAWRSKCWRGVHCSGGWELTLVSGGSFLGIRVVGSGWRGLARL